MVDAIRQGRRVYSNLKKAVRYIISIHIPIILMVAMPLLLGWQVVDLFFPIHIIFLELIMGPTCSIVYENEPPEPGLMQQAPIPMNNSFLSTSALWLSVSQGVVIAVGILIAGDWLLRHGGSEQAVRTLFFFSCLFSNVFLTLFNRSDEKSVFHTLINPNRWMWGILLTSFLLIVLIASIPHLRDLFLVDALTAREWWLFAGIALGTTGWVEVWKWLKRRNS
jgi:Ca2+-transporting ATPase